jgi:diguanylate cyclase (GGDEF)-like protein/PAS domain S-box-containing protein
VSPPVDRHNARAGGPAQAPARQGTLQNTNQQAQFGQRFLLWLAGATAVLAGMLPPFLVTYTSYLDLSERVQTSANVQAVVVGRYASLNPDNWMFKSEHIEVILKGVHDNSMRTELKHHDTTVLVLGIAAPDLGLRRQAQFSVFGKTEGTVLVHASTEGLSDSLVLALFTGLLGAGSLLWLLNHFVLDRMRLADRQRRAVEDRMSDLVELSSDWFWEQDAHYRFTFTSETMQVGFVNVTRIGSQPWDQPTNLTPAQWAAHRDNLDARRNFVLRFATKTHRGTEYWAEIRGKPRFDADGSFIGYRGVGTDITERKRAEAELRLAATAFESREGIVITDAQRVILRVNQAFVDVTGHAAEAVVGQTPSLFKSHRHGAEFYRAMWQSIDARGNWQGEVWNRRKNGEIYPVWLTITAVRNEEGEVTHYVGAQTDITDQKRAQDRIEELAFIDQLTQLPNRTLLLDRLKQAMAVAHRNGTHGALLFIDLDNFKTLNDTLGHDKGDLLLQQVALRITRSLRDGDTVARFGGDEFVVVLGNLSTASVEAAAHTEAVAGKILTTLAQEYTLGDVLFQSSASIGVTLFKSDGVTVDDLLKQADLAMYRSKATGRNAMHFFDPTMQAVVLERALLERDLRQALHDKQFLLHFQPQILAASNTISGAEVLVRWLHPTRGMVSPANFIALAEESGLIVPLGDWVLETACSQLAKWAAHDQFSQFSLAVNVSAVQFRQPDFVDKVHSVLHRTGALGQRLKLELTESLLVNNVQEVVEKMVVLQASGVKFSLDDFGTGFSSLAYLKRLPLDQLKIDQSFVRDVMVDPNDAAIARTVVALGHSLGLNVIAEGVETDAQRDFLAQAHCDAFQGYFFSRPLPAHEFESFALRSTRKVLQPADYSNVAS